MRQRVNGSRATMTVGPGKAKAKTKKKYGTDKQVKADPTLSKRKKVRKVRAKF